MRIDKNTTRTELVERLVELLPSAFVVGESGGDRNPKVEASFRNLEDAQDLQSIMAFLPTAPECGASHLAKNAAVVGDLLDEIADRACKLDDAYELADTPENLAFVERAERYRYGEGNSSASHTRNNGLIFTSASILLDYCAHMLEAEPAGNSAGG